MVGNFSEEMYKQQKNYFQKAMEKRNGDKLRSRY